MIAIIMRTVIIYIVITVAIRLMGKRQIGDMQPNELVVTLLISEIAAIPLQDVNQPILSGVASVSVLIIFEILLSVLSMKSFFFRKIMSGKSVLIIKNGVIDPKAMQDVRMTLLDLVELLRGQNVFDISQVSFAMLEVNGDLSVLLKPEFQTVTANDLNLKTEKEGLMLPVISDGKIIKESLYALKTEKENVFKILKKNKTDIKDVFLMTLDRYNNFNIITKESKV